MRESQSRLPMLEEGVSADQIRFAAAKAKKVTFSREAARSAGTKRHMMDDSADGIYPADVPVVVLRVIMDASNHEDSGFSRMASHSL